MTRYRLLLTGLMFFAAIVGPLGGQVQQQAAVEERVDLEAFAKIREEGLQRSQVMELASYLTDVYGPRLTNSPNIKAAAQWTAKTMNGWGLDRVQLEPWGPFGPGWSNERFYVAMVKPYPFPLIGYSKAWAPGTSGTVSGEVVLLTANTREELDKHRGTLKGKFVMRLAPATVTAQFQPQGVRYTDEQLQQFENPPQRGRGGQQGGPQGGRGQRGDGQPQPLNEAQRNQFFFEEGVLAVIEHGGGGAQRGSGVRGTGGVLFVQGVGNRTVNPPPMPPQVVLAAEHYGMLARNIQKNVPVVLELNVENKFHTEDLNAFNVIGEIKGTDRADEIVMIGAHFDSWHTGTGATDNASGSAIMMEVMRILKATGLPLRRTVRIGLWTGEEQGLFGSQAYVRDNFAVRNTMQLKPAFQKFSVYFNVDNGTGQIRGVWMEGNEAARPVFQAWMQPFRDFGMTTLSPLGTGGTDHTRFDEVGLPGFQFIQDDIEYDTRTHHSNMDVYERLQSRDMMQNAVIVASFVYQAANREGLLPRKALPAPPRGQN
jgi:hypothetical protein